MTLVTISFMLAAACSSALAGIVLVIPALQPYRWTIYMVGGAIFAAAIIGFSLRDFLFGP